MNIWILICYFCGFIHNSLQSFVNIMDIVQISTLYVNNKNHYFHDFLFNLKNIILCFIPNHLR